MIKQLLAMLGAFMVFAACTEAEFVPEPTPALIVDRFVDVSRSNLPLNDLKGKCMDATHGDLDGDGDLDIVLAQENATNLVLLNDGAALFTIGSLEGGEGDNEDVRLVDLDADGDLDLVTVHEDDQKHFALENNGLGGFLQIDGLFPSELASTANALEIQDLNLDGLPELLIGNAGLNLVLSQQDDGSFLDATAMFPIGEGLTQDLLLVDVDNDGDDDLFVVNEEANQLLINNGDGMFVDETNRRLPGLSSESREADAADVDRDGDLDIVVANVEFNRDVTPANQLLINDGTGVFVENTTDVLSGVENEDSSFTIRFVDIDDDGDPDVLSPANDLGDGGGVNLWVNNGDGSFQKPDGALFSTDPSGSTFDIEVVDLNGDGSEDIYFCNRTGTDQLYLGG